jgi:hypothetical protein
METWLSCFDIEWFYLGVSKYVAKQLKTLTLAHARCKGCNIALFRRWGSCQCQYLNSSCARMAQTTRQLGDRGCCGHDVIDDGDAFTVQRLVDSKSTADIRSSVRGREAFLILCLLEPATAPCVRNNARLMADYLGNQFGLIEAPCPKATGV